MKDNSTKRIIEPTRHELDIMCANIVSQHMEKEQGYNIMDINEKMPVQFMAEKNGTDYVVIVRGDFSPKYGTLDVKQAERILEFYEENTSVTPMLVTATVSSDEWDKYKKEEFIFTMEWNITLLSEWIKEKM